ncbi:GxxExxY protein [Methanolobus sp. WCC5]|uniref:GxxExxY protein n=1 Tax=Methanolobus sp. WCC5 TaxID=3125785 RepID=UPI003246A803
MDVENDRLNDLTDTILGAAFEVSNTIGVGFLEKVYENALNLELNRRGLKTNQQAPLNVYYKGEIVGNYFADILVEDQVIIELKTVKDFDDIHVAQCLNYLKITGLSICLLINFNKPRVQVKRIINSV